MLTISLLLLPIPVMSLAIASLGSSYAQGPGLNPNQTYPYLIANRLNATLIDASISGSLLVDINIQVSQIPANTDIVTLTSGGNDLGYVAGLAAEMVVPVVNVSGCNESTLVDRFNSAFQMIQAKAPNATIYVVEYVTLLGPDVVPGKTVPFNASRVAYHKDVFQTLQQATKQGSDGKQGIVRIPISYLSCQQHSLGAPTPWINGATAPSNDSVPWHPNAAGHSGIADILYSTIVGSY
jgi:hypothetical protein